MSAFFGEAASADDLIVMVNKYATNNQSYDGAMARAVESITVDEVPVSEGSNVYNTHPAPVGGTRMALFELLSASLKEAALAHNCLIAIDELRDEHGIAAGDTGIPTLCRGGPGRPKQNRPG